MKHMTSYRLPASEIKRKTQIHSPNGIRYRRDGIIRVLIFCLLPLFATAQWIQQGPGPSENGQVEGITDGHIAGAVNCVTPHLTNADILYIGSVGGGVWRTLNAQDTTPTWTMITSDLSSQAIGALEFDPTDATGNTLVLGNNRNISSFGTTSGGTPGVFRTTTGSGPWTNIDTGGNFATQNITGIAARGSTIIAATISSGIWQTTDTGVTWNQISGDVGTGLPAGGSFDLVGDPNDNTIFYTNSGTNGIYKSTDTGANWTKVSDATVDASLGFGNLELAVGNNDNVFVAVVAASNLSAVFRSGNGGSTWTALDIPTTIETGISYGIHVGGQGGRHLSITADPSDDNVVYVGGDRQPWGNEPTTVPFIWPNSLNANNFTGRLFRIDASLPSGSQFTSITHVGTAGNSAPHADSRDMDWDANGDLIEGDDGGVYKQTSPEDATGDWFSLNGNINIAEIHSMDWDANANIVIAGLQDNGVPQQEFPTNSTWNSITQGDGGDIAVDDISSTSSSTRFSSSQVLGNFRRRVYSSGNVFQSQFFPSLTDLATGLPIGGFAFVNPIKINSQNGNNILIATNGGLFESLDQGNTLTSIGNFTINSGGSDVLAYGANDNANIIYAGSGFNVQIRTAAGAGNFNNSTAYSGGFVIGISLDPDDSQSAYIIDNNSVFETDDTGGSYTDITGNLGGLNPGTFRSVAYIPNSGEDILAVGTDLGVYIASGPAFNIWAPLGTNLPQAPVFDMEYDTEDEILLVGLMGRGAWTFNFSERDPVDVALVMDISGSMLNDACSGCDTKLDVLKDAVEIFAQLWKGLAVDDDRIGAVYFRTNVDEFTVGGDVMVPVIPNTDTMIDDVRAQNTTASELTAMGGGLQNAINELTDDTRPRNIILLTDGVQNVDPGVAFPSLDIVNGEYGPNSNISPTSPATTLDNALGIKVNTIGIGATSSFETQLADISSATDGITKLTTAPDEDLRQFYVEELVDVLRSFSPQLVAYRKGTLVTTKQENFTINNTTRKIVFKVSYERGDEVGVSIRKGSTDVTQLADRISGQFYQIFTFPYERLNIMKGPKYEGEWAIALRNGASPASYEVAAITDESSLKYNFSTGVYPQTVGKPIEIGTEVLVNGDLVTEDISVTATVLRSGKGLGTLLSTTPRPATGITAFEPNLPLGAQKLTLLSQKPSFVNQMKPVQNTITLTPSSDKVFRANITNTNVPGTYTVIYKIAGTHPYLGEFVREEQRSIVVRFSNFDFDDSDVRTNKQGPDSSGNYTWTWTFEPKDEYGNYLGPDYGTYLDINSTTGTTTDIRDLGDGTYEIDITTVTDSKPDISIELYDEVWYDGIFPDPSSAGNWFASIHAGATLPQGNLGNNFNTGLYGKLDLEWRFKKSLSVQLLAGLDHFNPNLNVAFGALQLKGYLPLSANLNAYGELGPGVHFIPKDKAYLGLDLGVGLDFELNAAHRLSLGVNYIGLSGHPLNYKWLTAGVGFHFRL